MSNLSRHSIGKVKSKGQNKRIKLKLKKYINNTINDIESNESDSPSLKDICDTGDESLDYGFDIVDIESMNESYNIDKSHNIKSNNINTKNDNINKKKPQVLANMGSINIVFRGDKSKPESKPESKPGSKSRKEKSKKNKKKKKITDDDNDSDSEYTERKRQYTTFMDNIVEKIKAMNWGDTIRVDSDPFFICSDYSNKRKKQCAISKIVRFNSFMFMGSGSKNILRYFMNKTKLDDNYKYEIIIQLLTNNSIRRFMPIRSWGEFWGTYADEPIRERYLFEVIRSDRPCKPYLDIEWKVIDHDPRKTDYSEIINQLSADIIEIFRDRYRIIIDESAIMISSSHSKDKVSFHIVIDKLFGRKTVAFRTNRKGVPESAWDLWVALIEHNKKYEKMIDGNVYTTDREFRTIYSSKAAEFRPIIPYNTKICPRADSIIRMKKEKCLRYIVTHSAYGEFYHITTPPVPQKYANTVATYNPETYLPPTYTDKTISHIISLVRDIHPTAEYTGRSQNAGNGWRFTYRDKNEPCYTGNYHESNGFYVFENPDKGIKYMKCMSDECKGIHIIEGNANNSNSGEYVVIKKKLFK